MSGEECRAEGASASSRTRVSSGHGVGWMVRLKGPSQELLRQHPQVVLDREHLRLLMEVSDWCPLGAARGNAKRLILNSLQFSNIGWGCVGEPNRSCVVKYGADEEFVGDSHGLNLLPPVGGAEVFEEVYPGYDSGAEVFDVFVEGEEGVESNSQDTRVTL